MPARSFLSRPAFARLIFALFPLTALAACAGPATEPGEEGAPSGNVDLQAHTPDFARRPYEAFSRQDAVAIALREWRAWGMKVNDAPPDEKYNPPAEDKPERWPGMWQRVGEYWWLGVNADRREAAYTGKHDDVGMEFDSQRDETYAWSAAFISYIMRTDGAGLRFPYSQTHATYINAARRVSLGKSNAWAVSAEAPWAYAPRPGDLICAGRRNRRIRFQNLPAGYFPGHCDIVVAAEPGQISVVGGNVDDSVTMKHVPVTADGMLTLPNGTPVDTRYPWFVVLRVLYTNDSFNPALDRFNETPPNPVISSR